MIQRLFVACSGPGAGQVIADAERFSFVASLVSIPCLLVAAGAFFLGRDSLRICCLNLIPLTIHPVWSMGARSGDCGIALRQASTAWIFISLVLAANAIASIRRHGLSASAPRIQFSIRSLLVLCTIIALAAGVSRTSLIGYLPLLGLISVTGIAAWPVPYRNRTRQLPKRIDVPLDIGDNKNKDSR